MPFSRKKNAIFHIPVHTFPTCHKTYKAVSIVTSPTLSEHNRITSFYCQVRRPYPDSARSTSTFRSKNRRKIVTSFVTHSMQLVIQLHEQKHNMCTKAQYEETSICYSNSRNNS